MSFIKATKAFKDKAMVEAGPKKYFKLGFMIVMGILALYVVGLIIMVIGPIVGYMVMIALALIILGWLGEKVWELFINTCKQSKKALREDNQEDVIITPPPVEEVVVPPPPTDNNKQ